MNLRDEVETVLRSWDAHERERGAPPVIDYDFYPTDSKIEPARSRLEVFEGLERLQRQLAPDTELALIQRLAADLSYLRALMGERLPLSEYVRETQGCPAIGWPKDYITAVGERARDDLAELGIGWNSSTLEDLEEIEGKLTAEEAPEAIRRAATELEHTVRDLVDTRAAFNLSIEKVEVDAYWAYWVDGVGSDARLRLNLRNARFTQVTARQFALHEVLGHALQGASLAEKAATSDVAWVRLLSVHTPQEVLFEGLAQALPLLVTPNDPKLTARVRVAHYLQLVRAEIHLAINAGRSIHECVAHARTRVPFWDGGTIAGALSDTSTNPLLRSYLWAYPAGIDWFVTLLDKDPALARDILKRGYETPLTPRDLEALWIDGPPIGGHTAP